MRRRSQTVKTGVLILLVDFKPQHIDTVTDDRLNAGFDFVMYDQKRVAKLTD